MNWINLLLYIVVWLGAENHAVIGHPTATHIQQKTNIFQVFFGISNRIRTCNCKCGLPNRQSKLLGGTELQPYEFPWLAQIHIKCRVPVQGTLINDRFVISSAAALIGLSPYDVKVEVGRFDACNPDVTSTMLSVLDIRTHPEYQFSSRQNDLALLHLNQFVPYHRRVSPICLPTPNYRYTHQVATLAAWINGIDAYNRTVSTCSPRKIDLPILDSKQCSEQLPESQSCVGVVGAPSVLCKSDTGSGVLYRSHTGHYELIGVLSDKQNCHATSAATITSPSMRAGNEPTFDYYLPMFTRINSHINWILENTRDGCYCNKP